MILGLMSSLLPRVCASWVPGQSKTHGHSGFENDVEDLVTDLPAAFVAIDVPAAFHVPEVFVDAAMIASDYWVSLFGAALSALFDAMLCLQTDDLGVSSLMNVYGFWERFLVSSGMLRIISHSVLSPLVASWPCVSSVSLPLLLRLRCARRVEWLLLLCAWPQSSGRSASQRPVLSLVS